MLIIGSEQIKWPGRSLQGDCAFRVFRGGSAQGVVLVEGPFWEAGSRAGKVIGF